MKLLSLKASVAAVSVIDVLLGTALITYYVYLLADHVHELQILHGSKGEEVALYVFISCTSMLRILVALKLYNGATKPREPGDIQDVKCMSLCWIIVSFVLLIYWSTKAIIFEQHHAPVEALILCYVEICFRVCGICIVKLYMNNLWKESQPQQRQCQF